ncbi:MAG: hypothetical protein ACFFD4_07400 [Candidatus Odinarchaeota archaeon]
MNENDVLAKLEVFCTICKSGCVEQEQLESDHVLFEQCLMIMQDDLSAAIEYLRLNSPLDQVICNIKNFIYHVIKEGKKLEWYDKRAKKMVNIPPEAFTTHFRLALKRWRYELPERKVFDDVEEVLAAGLRERFVPGTAPESEKKSLPVKPAIVEPEKKVARRDTAQGSKPLPLQSFIALQTTEDSSFQPAINLMRSIETDCPACGCKLSVPFEEEELETLLDGGRMMEKAVEHGDNGNSHVVELLIDSQLRIRRTKVLRLVKAVV